MSLPHILWFLFTLLIEASLLTIFLTSFYLLRKAHREGYPGFEPIKWQFIYVFAGAMLLSAGAFIWMVRMDR